MDINIDGASSTYNKDDPRGIHVGHSIYFADEYWQFYYKYINMPIDTIDTTENAMIGIKTLEIYRPPTDVTLGPIDWENRPITIVNGSATVSIKFEFYDDDMSAFDETINVGGAENALFKITYGRIKNIIITRDDSISEENYSPSSVMAFNGVSYDYSYFLQLIAYNSPWHETSVKKYYDEKSPVTVVSDVVIPKGLSNNVLGITNTNMPLARFYTSLTTAFSRIQLTKTLNANEIDSPTDNMLTDIEYPGLNIIRDAIYPLGYNLDNNTSVIISPKIIKQSVADQLYYVPKKINGISINREQINPLYANAVIHTPGGSIGSMYGYSLFGGSSKNSSNPYYDSDTEQEIYPFGVQLTLNRKLYNHYVRFIDLDSEDFTVYDTKCTYNIHVVGITGAHFTLNGSVTGKNHAKSKTLQDAYDTVHSVDSVPLIGMDPRGTKQTHGLSKDIMALKPGAKLIMCVDDYEKSSITDWFESKSVGSSPILFTYVFSTDPLSSTSFIGDPDSGHTISFSSKMHKPTLDGDHFCFDPIFTNDSNNTIYLRYLAISYQLWQYALGDGVGEFKNFDFSIYVID